MDIVKRTKYKAKAFEIEFDFDAKVRDCDGQQFIFYAEAPFIPIGECIKQSIIGGIQLQSFIVDKVTLFLFMDKLKLMQHFECLNRFYLMNNGDLMNRFCAILYAKQPRSLTLLNFIFFSVAKTMNVCVKRLKFIESPLSGRDQSILMEMVGDSSHFLSKLFLNYHVEWPLTEIITAESIKNYNFIFVFFLYLHHVQAQIIANWKEMKQMNKMEQMDTML